MSDGKYFHTTKKGEIAEFRDELNNIDRNKQKEAVKKVIAAMTVGKDVSSLFTDIVKLMQTQDIELKKLIYLYIINYARAMPEQSILVVNSFQRDASYPNPLVRGLAIRTLGMIRVDRLTEYLSEPLAKALTDTDPYVRKTAAICTAKLYDINSELVEEQGFLDQLRDLIFNDGNPMVVANAVAALTEISQASNRDLFRIDSNSLQKLLTALDQCTEWGQVFILDALAQYEPSNEEEAERVIERVSPRLQHVNSAVVLSAINIILKYMNKIEDESKKEKLYHKLSPPLVTLLSTEPEIQYVTLRNINLIVQKYPMILQNEVKVFFVKYDDPLYVKMEKLEIIIKLANSSNLDKVLPEFKEYATEVDVEFVRKAVRAIGRCAIKLEEAAERCIHVLLDLISTKVNYIVQEAVIVIKDIFRRYPNRYESIIGHLCENLDTLDEPEAKASMIWIIGEYAERIDNAADLMESFVDTFIDEHAQVQLQLLTAVVKLFLKHPEHSQELVTRTLNLATESSDNPDLRDRGFVYWRLLSTDPEAAKAIVLVERPPISDDTFQLDPSVLDILINNLSTLASVYHKPPETFIKGLKSLKLRSKERMERKTRKGKESDEEDESETTEEESEEEESEEEESDEESEEEESDEEESDEEKQEKRVTSSSSKKHSKPISQAADIDLLGLDDLDLGFGPPTSSVIQTNSPPQKIVLSQAQGKGLQISLNYIRKNNNISIDFTFENMSQQPLSTFLFQLNKKNSFGLAVAGPLRVQNTPITPMQKGIGHVDLISSANLDASAQFGQLQMALRTELGDFYFSDKIPSSLIFEENGNLEGKEYINIWRNIGDDLEHKFPFSCPSTSNTSSIIKKLSDSNIFNVVKKSVAGKGDVLYQACKFKGTSVLFELTLSGTTCSGSAKSNDLLLTQIVSRACVTILES